MLVLIAGVVMIALSVAIARAVARLPADKQFLDRSFRFRPVRPQFPPEMEAARLLTLTVLMALAGFGLLCWGALQVLHVVRTVP